MVALLVVDRYYDLEAVVERWMEYGPLGREGEHRIWISVRQMQSRGAFSGVAVAEGGRGLRQLVHLCSLMASSVGSSLRTCLHPPTEAALGTGIGLVVVSFLPLEEMVAFHLLWKLSSRQVECASKEVELAPGLFAMLRHCSVVLKEMRVPSLVPCLRSEHLLHSFPPDTSL